MLTMSKNLRAKKKQSVDPSYTRMKPDFFPVQRQFQIGVISAAPYVDRTKFLSTPQALSEINNRLYRVGNKYTLSIALDNDAPAGQYEVYCLVNSWQLANAFAAGRAAYETAIADETAIIGKKARWHDFNPENGFSSEICGAFLSSSPGTFSARNDGEHINTQVTGTDGNTRMFTWGPTSSTSKYSLVREYDNMGNTDEQPITSVLGGYEELQPGTASQDIANIQQHGDLPPYARTAIPNVYLVKIATLENTATGSQRLSTGFFEALCGYVWIRGPTAEFPDAKLTCTVKAGNYKGVHAESMAVMK